MKLSTRRPVPALSASTVAGSPWVLAEQKPRAFSMIAFYRGLHCPKCALSLGELNRKAGDFETMGVSVFALSCDSEERAAKSKRDWGLDNLTIGYGLSIDSAREWGLYISTGRGVTSTGVEEPDLFCEPGLFVVEPDGALYMTAVQSMPFARPLFAEVLKAIQFIIEKGYPPRGDA